MSKKRRSHYCRICHQYKANEKFSGHGHSVHICKACSKRGNKPPEIVVEEPVYIEMDEFDADDNSVVIDAFDGTIYDDFDIFAYTAVEEPPKPKKKKRKPSKEKLLRAAQKKTAKAFLCVEMSMGQMVEDVRLAVDGERRVEFFGRTGGLIPEFKEIMEQTKKLYSEVK